MKLDMYILMWVVLAAVTISLAIYRKIVANHEDYAIHMKESEALQTTQQAQIAKKLDMIDYLGEVLTVVTLVAGLVLSGAYLYGIWQSSLIVR